ncbi:hypothetical protein ACTJKK_12975 [Microbacterium sp. 22179]|jgi:hypothetical protein|uniref:hypothetical protein n=1 Tax=Microbacterium sp. 22179 TaxID=3453886 RepID=UPI003F82EEDB
MTEEELFERAREVNFAYKRAVADVQVQIFDGDWDLTGYGDFPDACASGGYEFDLIRYTPEGWHLNESPEAIADRVAAWLSEHGWTDIKTRGYSGEIADVVVEAEHPGNYVESLVVDISPGDLYDHVALYATSTCEPGDWHVIAEMRRPGDAPKEQQPATEHPTAPLSFGFDADGKRRFWDESG